MPIRRFRLATPLLPLILLSGCSPAADDPSAADTRAMVLREGANAMALSTTAVQGRVGLSTGRWESCMAYPVWRYKGFARLSIPEGEAREQLAAMDKALREAGYSASLTRVEGKLVAGRGDFSFVIEQRRLKPDQPPQWHAVFQSQSCRRFSARERRMIRAMTGEESLDMQPTRITPGP